MNELEPVVAAIVGVVGLIVLVVGWATVKPVSGIWRREAQSSADEEYIQFEQMGPFVTGKRNVDGGNHIYSGIQLFNTVRLTRRDFGLPALIAQGFPPIIAKKLNGSVVAKLRLKRRGDQRLEGSFTPQKILFDEPSARVLSRRYQSSLARAFALTDLAELPQLKGSAVRSAGLPPPAEKVKRNRKNTF